MITEQNAPTIRLFWSYAAQARAAFASGDARALWEAVDELSVMEMHAPAKLAASISGTLSALEAQAATEEQRGIIQAARDGQELAATA